MLKKDILNQFYYPLLGLLITGLYPTYRALVDEIAIIENSTSSTAAIGYIFLPVLGIIMMAIWGLGGLLIGIAVNMYKEKQTLKSFVFGSLGAIIFISVLSYSIYQESNSQEVLDKVISVRQQPPEELIQVINNPQWKSNSYVIGAMTENPKITAELLDEISKIDSSELYEKFGGNPDVMGKNKKGLAVMRLVASHPLVLEQTLEYIANNTNNEYVLSSVVSNEKTPIDILKREVKKNHYLIRWSLPYNKKCPSEILSEVYQQTLKADESSNTTLGALARHPNTDIKILKELSTHSDYWVRREVSLNPNVPIHILKQLESDANSTVRKFATRALKDRLKKH